jgi:hypothetical protein
MDRKSRDGGRKEVCFHCEGIGLGRGTVYTLKFGKVRQG